MQLVYEPDKVPSILLIKTLKNPTNKTIGNKKSWKSVMCHNLRNPDLILIVIELIEEGQEKLKFTGWYVSKNEFYFTNESYKNILLWSLCHYDKLVIHWKMANKLVTTQSTHTI